MAYGPPESLAGRGAEEPRARCERGATATAELGRAREWDALPSDCQPLGPLRVSWGAAHGASACLHGKYAVSCTVWERTRATSCEDALRYYFIRTRSDATGKMGTITGWSLKNVKICITPKITL